MKATPHYKKKANLSPELSTSYSSAMSRDGRFLSILKIKLAYALMAFLCMAGASATGQPTSATGRQWHVSVKGNNNNSGRTAKAAFATLKKAAAVAGPGDVVLIYDGFYTDTDTTDNSNLLSIRQSGRPGAWITWKAAPGQHPLLYATGWGGINISGSYHLIEGLTLKGANDSLTLLDALADVKNTRANPAFNTNGIIIDGRRNPPSAKPHHIIIRNCSVGNFPGGGITAIEFDHLTIEGCEVFNNCWYMRFAGSGITTLNNWTFDDAPGYHVTIRRNRVWNNKTLVPWDRTGKLSDGNGILLDVTDLSNGATNPNADAVVTTDSAKQQPKKPQRPEWKGRALIANNISAYNGGSGIHTFRTRHVDIINNTTYHNGQVVKYQELFANRSDDVVILNNVMVPRPGGKVTSANRNTAIRWDYNLYPVAQDIYTAPHDVVADPLLQNISMAVHANNFQLAKGSKGIGTATSDVAQPTDINGTPRPAGTGRDRGAYEQ